MPETAKIRGNDIDIGLTQEDIVTIQAITPVKTGLLQSNFTLDRGSIVNPTFYGEWRERGTNKMEGAFMVEKSIPAIANRLVERVIKQLDQAKLLDLPKKLI